MMTIEEKIKSIKAAYMEVSKIASNYSIDAHFARLEGEAEYAAHLDAMAAEFYKIADGIYPKLVEAMADRPA